MSLITTTEEKIIQNVNLHHIAKQSPQTARKGAIQIDRRDLPIYDWIFDSHPRERFRLELEVDPSPLLTYTKKENILRLSLIGVDSPDNVIDVRQNDTSYLVEFYPDEILDCKVVETDADGKENAIFPVNYTITLRRVRDDKEVGVVHGKIDVFIEPVNRVEPKVTFVPLKDCVDGVVFTSKQDEKVPYVGNLEVRCSGQFYRSPAINLLLSLEGRIDDEPKSGLFTLGKPTCEGVDKRRPILNPELVRKQDGQESNLTTGGCCVKCDLVNGKVEISNLFVEPGLDVRVAIPVYLNMASLSNPANDVNLSLFTTSVYRKYYEPKETRNTIVNEAGSLLLKRNTRIMDLEVFAGPDSAAQTDEHRIKNEEEKVLKAEYVSWASPDQRYPTLNFEYVVNNSADAVSTESPEAALIVKDLRITTPQTAPNVTIAFRSGKSMEDMFRIRVPEEGKVHRLMPDSLPIVIPIEYSDEHLVRMTEDGHEVFNTFVRIGVSFNYCLDKMGSYPEDPDGCVFRPFRSTLAFKVFKRALPEWLCLDFGTSAVVASFARDLRGSEAERLLPLEASKQELDLKVWPNVPTDRSEGSQYLISSAAVLAHDDLGTTLQNPKVFGSSAVLFSPPAQYTEYYRQLLPCLKSLIGNEYLPSELIPVGTRRRLGAENEEGGRKRIVVEDVLKIIYQQLFRFYVPDRVMQTERLVLSFPNTFAPKHIDVIKGIATEVFKPVRRDYLRSISESDAVAFYYNHHRQTFIQQSSMVLMDGFDKHVLVYDMGAGTLDLTYFVRSRVHVGKDRYKTRISIEGKMGMNMAGNYLDFILADVLVNLLCQKDGVKNNPGKNDLAEQIKNLMKVKDVPESRSLKDAFALKNYVKDTLKIHLDDPTDMPLPGELNLFGFQMPLSEIRIKDVVEADEFKEFLSETTQKVFEHFVSLFGKGDEGAHRLPVDVVLFSGRMTGCISLRKAVKKALEAFGKQEKEVLFADLSARKFIEIDEKVESITGLKTVVVDGALAYCQGEKGYELVNSNVYGTYGVFLVDHQNTTEWLPLIDYRTKPLSGKESLSDDGLVIREYDTKFARAETTSPINPQAIDLSNYHEIILVQTYSRDPLANWKKNRKELISVIGTFSIDLNEIDPIQSIRLRIDSDNQLIFSIGNQPQQLLPHDDYEGESFARAMWPIVRTPRIQSNANTQTII